MLECNQRFFEKRPSDYIETAGNSVDLAATPIMRRPNNPLREFYLIVGAYCVEEISALMELANSASFFLIVEPEPDLFRQIAEKRDIGFLGKRPSQFVVAPLDRLEQVMTSKVCLDWYNYTVHSRVHVTEYYLQYRPEVAQAVVDMFMRVMDFSTAFLGNSIEDSLMGMEYDIQNLRHLPRSLDVAAMKGQYNGVPGIIVAAGPSLDKNVHLLHEAKYRALIFAVDTVLPKLLGLGIVPDYVCTIERERQVYNRFYAGQEIPDSVTLVAAPCVDPVLLKTYPGPVAIPFRKANVNYRWLNQFIGLHDDAFVDMGNSSAHLALGFAAHLGCSPLVLVGQDLAFGERDGQPVTHAGATGYHGMDDCANEYNAPSGEVEGYYGGMVMTSCWWQDTRTWIENKIAADSLYVINATEGGARIKGTEQHPLADVVEEMVCMPVFEYPPLYAADIDAAMLKMRDKLAELRAVLDLTDKLRAVAEMLNFSDNATEAPPEFIEAISLAEKVRLLVLDHDLLRTMSQHVIVRTMQKWRAIPEIPTAENFRKCKDVLVEIATDFGEVIAGVIKAIERGGGRHEADRV